MRARLTLASPAAASPAFEQSRPAGWHSPVPYLFGGLAAMLGLIAFALLILACSYWRLSGNLNSGSDETDPESGETSGDGEKGKKKAAEEEESMWENKVLVIMAGQVMPTFLATPSTSRSTSFGETNSTTVTDNFESDDDDHKKERVDVHHHQQQQQQQEHTTGGDAGVTP